MDFLAIKVFFGVANIKGIEKIAIGRISSLSDTEQTIFANALNKFSNLIQAIFIYMLRTTMRLIVGMLFSFVFALVIGYAYAKNKHFARVCLPIINFLESAPLLDFLTFTTAYFYSHIQLWD
ncbi:hypothetical protein AS144_02785 [Francisella endosymbiont of Amblyomma maculatum]|nr:hypothetical protein AS144_02785 [Francisella endosymbiont of Amblyomma maculatum]